MNKHDFTKAMADESLPVLEWDSTAATNAHNTKAARDRADNVEHHALRHVARAFAGDTIGQSLIDEALNGHPNADAIRALLDEPMHGDSDQPMPMEDDQWEKTMHEDELADAGSTVWERMEARSIYNVRSLACWRMEREDGDGKRVLTLDAAKYAAHVRKTHKARSLHGIKDAIYYAGTTRKRPVSTAKPKPASDPAIMELMARFKALQA